MPKIKPATFILDVDGVFTDGSFLYSTQGKVYKRFGAEDHDALSILSPYLHIEMISGDKRGFDITQKRIQEDMGFKLTQVSTFERVKWMKEHFDLTTTVYMGDGIYDSLVFNEVAYSIAPQNAFYFTKEKASFVTQSIGGSGAVAEAVFHLMETFFEPITVELLSKIKKSGAWK